MSRPGDWNCKSCQHLNFGWRDLCQKCGGTLNGKGSTFVFSTPGALPGDWYCKSRNCGALNYAKRSKCFKCSILKDESDGVYEGVMPCPGGFVDRPGFKSGDWICAWPGCNEHNFASRTECFTCHAPRNFNCNPSYQT